MTETTISALESAAQALTEAAQELRKASEPTVTIESVYGKPFSEIRLTPEDAAVWELSGLFRIGAPDEWVLGDIPPFRAVSMDGLSGGVPRLILRRKPVEPPPPAGYEWVRDEQGKRVRAKSGEVSWCPVHEKRPAIGILDYHPGRHCPDLYAVRPIAKPRRWVLEEEPEKRFPKCDEPFINDNGQLEVANHDYSVDKHIVLTVVERPE